MVTPFLRTAFRRHLELLRLGRLPQPPRRSQSSDTNPSAKPAPTETPIPVPGTVVPVSFWQKLGPVTRAGEAYGRAQRKRPWVTQTATAVVIYLCADISAQRISGKEYDPKRTARSMLIGAAAAIPNYTWFMWLSRSFNYPSKFLSIATKVVVQQICFAPVIVTYFFTSQALLSGESVEDTWERLKMTVPQAMVNSAKLWPAVMVINFSLIPMEYRSIFAGAIAVGWQTYLSYLNRRAEVEEIKMKEIAAVKPVEELRASAKDTTIRIAA